MRAIRVHEVGGPEVMRVEETPDPVPGPGQVLVRIRAAGVNPVDTYIRSGMYARRPALPYTPGHDGAGIVEGLGPPAPDGPPTTLRPGDRVWVARAASGTYAELAVCDAAHVHPLPERLTFAQGAALGVPCCTAWRALFQRAGARAGEWALIHGASGGVGIAAVQMAVAAGLRVVGTAGSDRGRELVAAQGAHHVLGHDQPDSPDRIMDLTGGRGVDLIVEMLANANLDRDLGMLAMRGRIVVVGSRGRVEIDPRLMMSRESSILGMSLMNASPEEMARVYAGVNEGLASGTLTPVVGRELPLAQAPRAHELVLAPGSYGKIVLVP